jgi:hypothetical protein
MNEITLSWMSKDLSIHFHGNITVYKQMKELDLECFIFNYQ